MGVARTAGSPVISVWISNDGQYAFIEFRSVEEAQAGYCLNNVSILGQQLRVGRPNTYAGNEPPAIATAATCNVGNLGLSNVSDEMASRLLGGSGKLMVSGLPHGFHLEDV